MKDNRLSILDLLKELERLRDDYATTYKSLSSVMQLESASEDEVASRMEGSVFWEDPPPDWTRRDLLMFCRGYLIRERSLAGNVASTMQSVIASTKPVCITRSNRKEDGTWDGHFTEVESDSE